MYVYCILYSSYSMCYMYAHIHVLVMYVRQIVDGQGSHVLETGSG